MPKTDGGEHVGGGSSNSFSKKKGEGRDVPLKSSSSKNKKSKSGFSELNAALTMTGGVQFALQPHNSHDPDETKEFVEKRLNLMGMLPKESNGSLSKAALQAMSFKHLRPSWKLT